MNKGYVRFLLSVFFASCILAGNGPSKPAGGGTSGSAGDFGVVHDRRVQKQRPRGLVVPVDEKIEVPGVFVVEKPDGTKVTSFCLPVGSSASASASSIELEVEPEPESEIVRLQKQAAERIAALSHAKGSVAKPSGERRRVPIPVPAIFTFYGWTGPEFEPLQQQRAYASLWMYTREQLVSCRKKLFAYGEVLWRRLWAMIAKAQSEGVFYVDSCDAIAAEVNVYKKAEALCVTVLNKDAQELGFGGLETRAYRVFPRSDDVALEKLYALLECIEGSFQVLKLPVCRVCSLPVDVEKMVFECCARFVTMPDTGIDIADKIRCLRGLQSSLALISEWLANVCKS